MIRPDDYELEQLNARFEAGYPQDVLEWAVDKYGQELVVVTSLQPTGIVTLHMLNEIMPGIPVLTLDTDLLFPETYDLIHDLEARFSLNLKRIRPTLTVAEQDAYYGQSLWQSNPNMCCNLRKVNPLDDALVDYRAWITGIRRDQTSFRAKTRIVAWDHRHDMIKLSPFAAWTEDMIWAYLKAHELSYNTLHDQGYPSIGCWPCTKAVEFTGVYTRAGRWAGQNKAECGIHLTAPLAQS